MTFTILASSEDRPAWLEARRAGLTATDLSRLANGGAAVWAKVRAEKAGNDVPFGNAYTQWGIEREPVIAAQVEAIRPVRHNTHLLGSTADPRILATPDLLDPNGAMVGDIKTAVWKGAVWDSIPPNYYDQLQVQMFVTGCPEAILATEYHEDFRAVFPEPHILDVEFDQDRMDELLDIANRFFADTTEPTHLDALIVERVERKEFLDSAKASLDEVDELIRKELEARSTPAYSSSFGSAKLSADSVARTFDSRRFEQENPDEYALYVKESRRKGRLTVTGAA